MMRTEEHRPVRLSEYRPPNWLVETVHLDVRLDPTQSPVRTTLKLKPNPAAGAPAPLVFDGDAISPAPTGSPSRSRRTGRSRSKSKPWSIRRPTRSFRGSIVQAAITAPSARPRASAASPIIRIGPT
jgi:hypothetical protein